MHEDADRHAQVLEQEQELLRAALAAVQADYHRLQQQQQLLHAT
jgi:hypothetical protein